MRVGEDLLMQFPNLMHVCKARLTLRLIRWFDKLTIKTLF